MRSTIKGLYAMILKSEREVMFSDEGLVYVIFESANGGWSVDVYETDEGIVFCNADNYELKLLEGGLCTGDEYEAIEFMMPTQLIDMDRASPQTRRAHT
ncbi:MAG: hypothetical protein NZ824_11140 [Candidatus Thioglobus sp.]|nr:hypothetical protein [Candidatus Thioglobus sp.]